jgi:lysozyme
MDDKTGSEYVQIATKSGAQVRLDETNGFVYLINRDGTAWVELDKKGNINIFGATNISMRAQKDINLRADRNINIEAGQNLYMKAAMDTVTSETEFTYDVNNVPIAGGITYYKYVGEGAGEGGNIVTQALFNTHTTVAENTYVTIGKNRELKIGATYDISAASAYNLTSPTIKNVGAVKIIGTLDGTDAVKFGKTLDVTEDVNFGKTLDVTEDVKFGATLEVTDGINATYGSFSDKVNASELSSSGNITGATISGTFPLLMPGPGAINGGPGAAGTPGAPVAPVDPVEIPKPPAVVPAEVKPLVAKVNILAPWADPESKFIRLSEAVLTTTSMFPTYEPCPEHEQFKFAAVDGWNPPITEGQASYTGSGSAGGGSTKSPAPNTDPGANNKELPPSDASESAVSKDFNNKAFECQIKIHEGVKYESYNDSLGLPTAGIGHLLREDEKSTYPVGTAVSEQQVSTWFESDSQTAISDAQRFVGTETWNGMDDNRKRAVADLAYNMGGPRLNKFNGLRSALQKGDYDAAGESLKNSKWYGQVGRRAPAITSQIVNGTDPNGCDKKFPST